jgi:hypothetical protein
MGQYCGMLGHDFLGDPHQSVGGGRSLTGAVDSATPTGRARRPLVGILAALERSLILERTQGRQVRDRVA